MKSGYKRLLAFETIIFIVLCINSFVSSILSDYLMLIFLLIIVVMFKFFFGFEKDRHRYTKDIIFDCIIFLLIFFLLFYLSGLIISFARTDNYYNIKDFINIILPIILLIITKEFLRYQFLCKSEGSWLLIVTTTLLFVFIDISTTLYYNLHDSVYNAFIFLSLTVLPAVSTNIVASYIGMNVGYKPMILFRLVLELYLYLIPIVPNPNQYIMSIIRLLLPVLFCYRVYLFLKSDHDEEVERKQKKRRLEAYIVPALLVILLVYFTSGYFHYQAVAIASGSMTPAIRKGDVVIVEKIDDDYDSLKEGQVIAFNYNGTVIVHRLVEKAKVLNDYYFYTKGDANEKRDNFVLTKDNIIGIVNIKIPYIGIPTVLINEL